MINIKTSLKNETKIRKKLHYPGGTQPLITVDIISTLKLCYQCRWNVNVVRCCGIMIVAQQDDAVSRAVGKREYLVIMRGHNIWF